MHKSATKCNETIGKWCKNKHGASKIIDTFETYQNSFWKFADLFRVFLWKAFYRRRGGVRGPPVGPTTP
jgi:hypothetical protein